MKHILAGSYYPLRRPLVSSFIGVSEKLQAATVRVPVIHATKTLESVLSPPTCYSSVLVLMIFFLIEHMLMAGSNVTPFSFYLICLWVLTAYVKARPSSAVSHYKRGVENPTAILRGAAKMMVI